MDSKLKVKSRLIPTEMNFIKLYRIRNEKKIEGKLKVKMLSLIMFVVSS